jgi:uncharacterized protein YfaP (DUF2135 family)
VSWHGGSAYVGHLYTDSSGRFSSPYTFSNGTGTVTYSIWAVSARESDYPYASAASNRVAVTVGP